MAHRLWAGPSVFFSSKYFLSEFESELGHVLALWPWACSAPPLCLRFFLCQMGTLTGLPHRAVEGRSGYCDKLVDSTRVPGL